MDAIRPEAPTRLFVACDGPNPERPGDAETVAATRQVIEQEIDWTLPDRKALLRCESGLPPGGEPRHQLVFRAGGGRHHP
jgi:hypothetical protein